MRFVLALLVGCSPPAPTSTTSPPKPLVDAGAGSGSGATVIRKVVIKVPFSLVVFDLEVIGTFSPAAAQLAKDFTTELRTAAHEYDGIGLGSQSQSLLDHKILMACDTEAPPCMAKIAQSVQADRIIYGHLEGPPYRSTIKLLVAETKYVVDWSTDSLDPNKLHETAREAIASLLSRSP